MTNSPSRRIAHLDMDAFYASIELRRYPQLRGYPVVVGGRQDQQPTVKPDGTLHFYRLHEYVGRGVITTATYEARALGVSSGMGTMKAAQFAPEAILLPADFDQYKHYSNLFKAAVARQRAMHRDPSADSAQKRALQGRSCVGFSETRAIVIANPQPFVYLRDSPPTRQPTLEQRGMEERVARNHAHFWGMTGRTFGNTGYVALYRHEVAENAVYVLAFRHQRECGY